MLKAHFIPLVMLSCATAISAFCYSDATSFETGNFKPDYTTTVGGVISHDMHFAGFSVVNDGTPSSPNTGVSDEDYPYFIAFNLADQGSSGKLKPSMQVGASGFSSFSLRTLNLACFQDKAGHNPSLPAVDCDITLSCLKGGRKVGSQTLQYTCGSNGDDCGSNGLKNAPMQAAALATATFACCQKIEFSATPHTDAGMPVAVGLDTLSYYYSSLLPISGASPLSNAACGC